MRKKLSMLFIAFFCLFFIQAIPVAASDDVVKNDESGIPDESLYQNILETLGKKTNETFTKQEAATIDWLDTRGEGHPIKSLKGIEYLCNVVQLDLRDHGIENLEGIEKLPKLKYLDLEGSSVKSLEPISHIGTLESLSINYSGLTTLKGIENLKNLKTLYVSGNQLKNIKEIKNLVNLESLYLDGNKLTSIKDVKKLRNLKTLDLHDNSLKKVEGLKNLNQLEKLNLSENKLTNVSEIKNLMKLKELSLAGNNLKKLPSLKNLKKLQIASFQKNYLTEKELSQKLPQKLWKNKKWRADAVYLQKLNAKVKLANPSSVNKITKNTTRISGSVSSLSDYKKESYVQLYNPADSLYRTKRWKVGADGKFEISGIKLKKWAGDTVYLNVLVYSRESKEWAVANSIKFTVK